ncbi:MAG: hypothetical protein FWC36_02015 [Spirochaetes bacterium]|nr:hypothetical protein [Spirochaetota bacterium]
MYNITLICSKHREIGKCNSLELYNIFKMINPEIIFEEIHSSRFDDYYKDQKIRNLETDAVRMYLKDKKIEQIPVDNYDISKIHSFYRDYKYMNKIINNNIDIHHLLNKISYMTEQYGFKFINSYECAELFEELNNLESNVIKRINDERLSRIYNLWNKITDGRENAMLKNIYNYSKENKYAKAIFVIGTRHKNSIIKKIQEYKEKEEIKLNWRFDNFIN